MRELERDDPRLEDDVFLVPVISDDPLLREITGARRGRLTSRDERGKLGVRGRRISISDGERNSKFGARRT